MTRLLVRQTDRYPHLRPYVELNFLAIGLAYDDRMFTGSGTLAELTDGEASSDRFGSRSSPNLTAEGDKGEEGGVNKRELSSPPTTISRYAWNCSNEANALAGVSHHHNTADHTHSHLLNWPIRCAATGTPCLA